MFKESAPRLSGTLGTFEYTLDCSELTVRPSEHFADREAAREAIEPYLRAWEESDFLSESPSDMTFSYEGGQVIDRNPDPRNQHVYPDTATGVGSVDVAAVLVLRGHYPSPDPQFASSPMTSEIVRRIRRVRTREAELPATAYWLVTKLEDQFGDRLAAAKALGVSRKIVTRLATLATQNDPEMGRKATGPPIPLTDAEVKWLRAAMARVARRTGELGSGAQLPVITMTDLPPLV